jgi:quinol monooxygenase YgiN
MSDPVRVVVKIASRADVVADIAAIVLALAAKSREEKGCVSYEVLQDMNERTIFVLVEEWESLAALDAHNRTPHFHEAVVKAGPLLAKPLEVGRYATIG